MVLITLLAFLPSIFFSTDLLETGSEWITFVFLLTLIVGMFGMVKILRRDDIFRIGKITLYILIGVLSLSVILFALSSLFFSDSPIILWDFFVKRQHIEDKTSAQFLILLWPVLLWWGFSQKSYFLRFLVLLAALLVIILPIWVHSRTAFAGGFVSFTIIAVGSYFMDISLKKKILLLLVIIGFMVVGVKAVKERSQTVSVRESQTSLPVEATLFKGHLPYFLVDAYRQTLWKIFIENWKEQPFVGSGFLSKDQRKLEELYLQETGQLFPKKDLLFHADNYFLQILHDTGLVGFIPFMAFLCVLFFKACRRFFHERTVATLLILALHVGFWTEGFFFLHVGREVAWFTYGSIYLLILLFKKALDEEGKHAL